MEAANAQIVIAMAFRFVLAKRAEQAVDPRRRLPLLKRAGRPLTVAVRWFILGRESDSLMTRCGPKDAIHSYLRATIGSIFMARRAGT